MMMTRTVMIIIIPASASAGPDSTAFYHTGGQGAEKAHLMFKNQIQIKSNPKIKPKFTADSTAFYRTRGQGAEKAHLPGEAERTAHGTSCKQTQRQEE
jgi:hypothetical protein